MAPFALKICAEHIHHGLHFVNPTFDPKNALRCLDSSRLRFLSYLPKPMPLEVKDPRMKRPPRVRRRIFERKREHPGHGVGEPFRVLWKKLMLEFNLISADGHVNESPEAWARD